MSPEIKKQDIDSNHKPDIESQTKIENKTQLNDNSESDKHVSDKKSDKIMDSISQTPIVCFKIQFYTSPVKLSVNSKQFKGLRDVSYYIEKSMYKYTVGGETDLNKAKLLLKQVKEHGFNDALIIGMDNGSRISITETLKKLKK